jgi:hypothetical protein
MVKPPIFGERQSQSADYLIVRVKAKIFRKNKLLVMGPVDHRREREFSTAGVVCQPKFYQGPRRHAHGRVES